MGIFSTITNEAKRNFIARPDEAKNDIIYKFPEHNIRMMTQLTCQLRSKHASLRSSAWIWKPSKWKVNLLMEPPLPIGHSTEQSPVRSCAYGLATPSKST